MSLIKKNPLVSIICNCYNGDKFLLKALSSVQKQSYKNWELIFWDVSSSDKSKKILESFKELRFKYYYSSKKKNLYHSRNDAIKKAKGELIAFIDCDDWWIEDKLEKQVPYFLDKSIGLVYSNCFSYFEKSKKIIKIKNNKIYSGFIRSSLLKSYHISILTSLIRKEVFVKLKGYNKKFHIVGDFEFNIRLSKQFKILGLIEPLAYYRIHDNNISKNFELEIKEFEYCLKIFKNNKINLKDIQNFNNFLTYKKFLNNIYKSKKFLAIKYFFQMKISFLKFKALLIFFIPKFIFFRLK